MYDLAALAIAAACFAFIFGLLWMLERVWCPPPTRLGSRFRSSSSRISSTRCSEESGS